MHVSEQVCIRWSRTDVYYRGNLTFYHGSSVKVWGGYYTSERIIFKFLE